MPELKNLRHEKFAHGIAVNKEPADAYIDAGFVSKSRESARKLASRLLTTHDDVMRRVDELRAPVIAKLELTTTQVLERLMSVAYADPGDAMVWGPNYIKAVDSEKLTPGQRAAIQEVKMLPDGSVVVKLRDPVPALKLIGQHRGLFQGESASDIAPAATTINDNRTMIYVDRPPRETFEEWQARQRRRLAGLDEPARPAALGAPGRSPKRSDNSH